jgi:hypothetical protein
MSITQLDGSTATAASEVATVPMRSRPRRCPSRTSTAPRSSTVEPHLTNAYRKLGIGSARSSPPP